jgi:hypothetical protein
MSALAPALIELRARQGRPAALAADAAHHLGVGTEERVDRGFGRVGEEAMAIDSDQELVGRDAGAAARLAIRAAAIARKFLATPLVVPPS